MVTTTRNRAVSYLVLEDISREGVKDLRIRQRRSVVSQYQTQALIFRQASKLNHERVFLHHSIENTLKAMLAQCRKHPRISSHHQAALTEDWARIVKRCGIGGTVEGLGICLYTSELAEDLCKVRIKVLTSICSTAHVAW